jgi:hypothetical protein
VVQFSYRIALIPDGLQGRVNSSFRLFAFLLNPVGAALCGWLLERGGSPPAVAVFGGATAPAGAGGVAGPGGAQREPAAASWRPTAAPAATVPSWRRPGVDRPSAVRHHAPDRDAGAAGRAARAAAPPACRRLQAQPVQRLHRPAARPAPAATGARPAAAGHRLP